MFSVAPEEFERYVHEGVEAIPERFRACIENVAFLVDDEPTEEQRRQNNLRQDETLLGLYEGIPRPARGEGYGGLVLPDKITIFKQPIELEANALVSNLSNSVRPYTIAKPEEMFKKEVKKLVVDTVWHEVAHHFGLDEEAVGRREEEREQKRV